MDDFAKWLREELVDLLPQQGRSVLRDLANLCAQQAEALEDIGFRHAGEDWRDDPGMAKQAAALRAAEEFQEKYG